MAQFGALLARAFALIAGLALAAPLQPRWSAGQIYNPGDGRSFSSTMTLESDGGLRIGGYFGLSLLGKTVEWVRPQKKPGRCG